VWVCRRLSSFKFGFALDSATAISLFYQTARVAPVSPLPDILLDFNLPLDHYQALFLPFINCPAVSSPAMVASVPGLTRFLRRLQAEPRQLTSGIRDI
jgi:hypothetical protein